MAKLFILLAVLALTMTLATAEPPRFRTSRRNGALRTNIRFLARQEEAPAEAPAVDVPADAAPAPYPPAGVTPETPFELPTETEAPAPDQTYGPPAEPDNTYGPPAEDADAAAPDNTYGPPDAQPTAADDLVSQNLIQPRNKAALRNRARPAPLLLRAEPVENAPRAGVVEIVRATPLFVYTLK